uniref:Uncharacterized protein n=1 Tax=Rhipicephalus microplus TaxID=6941 RepID=A0A6G5AG32_RHIMP
MTAACSLHLSPPFISPILRAMMDVQESHFSRSMCIPTVRKLSHWLSRLRHHNIASESCWQVTHVAATHAVEHKVTCAPYSHCIHGSPSFSTKAHRVQTTRARDSAGSTFDD